ncbi:MAG: hypothetical protein JW768_01815 [Chitinispirillaceae bacterium]|nr:hypothetical protein [Chitinispirillaceae bacterium]
MCYLAFVIGLTANAQTINLQGVVSNKTGQPIADAIVTLVGQKISDTTGSDGAFGFVTTAVTHHFIIPKNGNISMTNGVVRFTLSIPAPLKVDIFDVHGKRLKKWVFNNTPAGIFSFDIGSLQLSTSLLVIKAAIGSNVTTFRYTMLTGSTTMLHQKGASTVTMPRADKQALLAPMINDTIRVVADGFATKNIPVTSYDNQQLDITLDSVAADYHYMGNPPGPSRGCGKSLSTLKSGTYKITSAGLSREYIINIPTNYDPNNPYRLIFGMHWMAGTMQMVANDKFFQLKRFADSTKNYCIFVAPNGYGNDPLWTQGAKDHTFFDDMLKLCKEELCIDTTRVFSTGFSFGAMFTYSLSTNHQKQLRAVACLAPANYNIWLPTNTHEPIAYMSTTSVKDETCPWDGGNGRGAKYAAIAHATDNGCTIPATIPITKAGSKTHLCYDFQGCKDAYPVKVFTFDGKHQGAHIEGTTSGDDGTKSWIPVETWKFFMQF